MNCNKPNLLITGYPGTGKTTLVIKMAQLMENKNPSGFYTEEIRENDRRVGFKLISIDKKEAVLSHVDIKSKYRVSKYGVDVAQFDDFLEELKLDSIDSGLILIDEIGKMECFSQRFKKMINTILDNDEITLIATIAQKGGGFIDKIKQRSDIELFELTPNNRNDLHKDILQRL